MFTGKYSLGNYLDGADRRKLGKTLKPCKVAKHPVPRASIALSRRSDTKHPEAIWKPRFILIVQSTYSLTISKD